MPKFENHILRLEHVLMQLDMLGFELGDMLICADDFFLQVADLVLQVVRAWSWGAWSIHLELGGFESGKYGFYVSGKCLAQEFKLLVSSFS